MENTFSFDTIPQVLRSIVDLLEELLGKVNVLLSPNTSAESDAWMNIKDLCAYLPSHPTEKTVYGWTSSRTIPFHKTGKNISFRKSEIDKWLSEGKRASHQELELEALQFINSKKRKIV